MVEMARFSFLERLFLLMLILDDSRRRAPEISVEEGGEVAVEWMDAGGLLLLETADDRELKKP